MREKVLNKCSKNSSIMWQILQFFVQKIWYTVENLLSLNNKLKTLLFGSDYAIL